EALHCECRIVCDDDCSVLPDCDLVVASPGVPPLKSKLYRQAERSGIEFIGEMEFASRHCGKIPLLAVTGTNGKTTTTELVEHLLKRSGVDAVAAGNIGRPLSDVAADALISGKKPEVVALEVSNFQLEKAPTFAPFAAALLNLASDHEDRYADGFSGYCRVKKSIFDRVDEARRVYGLSFPDAPRRIVRKGDALYDGETRLIGFSGGAMASPHNLENLAAALELVRIFLGRYPELPGALENFAPGAHRMQTVSEICGRIFIDDSKATNPHAVFAALRAMTRPVVLLLGGLDKGMDFSDFAHLDNSRIRAVVLFGQCREKMRAALPGDLPCFDGGMDFEKTVKLAARASRRGDAVLLSPGCASFDMFKSYGDRGDRFQELAGNLSGTDFIAE
ncbi:MAG: hypothetical protein MJ016_08750, partial [Victivallaceae bacterium]|nr:hypothetical protein [Victivallaceae bacterium]